MNVLFLLISLFIILICLTPNFFILQFHFFIFILIPYLSFFIQGSLIPFPYKNNINETVLLILVVSYQLIK